MSLFNLGRVVLARLVRILMVVGLLVTQTAGAVASVDIAPSEHACHQEQSRCHSDVRCCQHAALNAIYLPIVLGIQSPKVEWHFALPWPEFTQSVPTPPPKSMR
ncbi:MAG: hypothetical protein HWE20_06600 [Gammaproteobacteria bacterium]|nr:hypothetical protein [Gammaproteobacteria bacterium]